MNKQKKAKRLGELAQVHLTDDGKTNKQQHKQHKPTTIPRGNNTPPRRGDDDYFKTMSDSDSIATLQNMQL